MPVIILAYHGVTTLESGGVENFQRKHLPAGLFERQMRYLRDHETLLSLPELLERYARGEDPTGVVVTFDDGYRNTVTIALPILERYGIPATCFLSTGFIGTDRMFWTDEIERLIDLTAAPFLDVASYGAGCIPLGSAEQTMRAITRLKAFLKQCEDERRRAVVEQLKAQCPLPPDAPKSPTYEIVNWEDVRRLAQSRVVEIGSHTVDHPILTRIAPDEASDQVQRSRCALEQATGRPVTMFAYPNGALDDYDETTVRIVREAGYRGACTTVAGPNTVATNVFALRRTMVGFCGMPFPFPAMADA